MNDEEFARAYLPLHNKYVELFGEQPPMFELPDDKAEMIKYLKKAVESGKPFNPYDEGLVSPGAII